MMINWITLILISLNLLFLLQEIPTNIIAASIVGLLLSLFVKGSKLRTFFKITLLLASLVLLRYHFKSLLVTECGVSLILILSVLKFWELEKERDHFNMFLILVLSECSIFLLKPVFSIFAFGLLKILFYFYYILKIRNYDISFLSLKRLFLLATPSIALSLILFYTFPRFTQGFINTNEMQYIIAGGASRFDFRQLGPLNFTNEQAFKVYGLENSNLPFEILYWRSSVLWQLSGDEWSSANYNLKLTKDSINNPKLNYKVEVVQNLKDYLPTLDGDSLVSQSSHPFSSFRDGSFKLKSITRGPLSYSVQGSSYGERLTAESPLMIKKGLKLNSKRKDEIAQKFFPISPYPKDDFERLNNLIRIFKSLNFEYSSNPPMYNSIEDFLSSGRSGYCSHFAAAFSYLARVYELPSRIVVGYLGGQLNPYDGSLVIRELDAHAWVEIFIKNKGWVKIDPTVLVVPERLTMSAEEFNNKLNPYITIFNFKIEREFFNFKELSNLSLWLDSLNSRFNTNIFNFDREKQLSVLRSLTPKRFPIGWLFATSLIFFLGFFWSMFYFFTKRSIDHDERRYLKFLKKNELPWD